MVERPLLFSAPMVRAILAGKKTVTRRPVTWRPGAFTPPQTEPTDHPGAPTWEPLSRHIVQHTHSDGSVCGGSICGAPVIRCPALAGDRLWVRETWTNGLLSAEEAPYLYRATYDGGLDLRWTPAIHMPREASRITLDVIDVRVERLHRIDDADAEREGVPDRQAFVDLWKSINGEPSWAENPWVWRIEFRKAGGAR